MISPLYIGRHRVEQRYASLKPVSGGLSFSSSFDATLVAEFKRAVPAEARKWDAIGRVWLVAPQYGQTCADLAARHLGISVTVPAIVADTEPTIRLLKLEYIGRVKEREGGEPSAFAWVNGGWNAILLESTLRSWFEAVPPKPGELPTLYAALGIKATAAEDEVRKAHRRLVFAWHPDRCREPDAAAQFKVIQHAYEVLADPSKRRKYDAGLKLAAFSKPPDDPRVAFAADGYRSPLRCGWVLCEGREMLGRFVAAKVLQWEDVVDAQGRTLVTSWPAGAETFVSEWR